MKLFHISHTDLDGYGCQLITKEYFKEGFFYNANYGLEVKLSIKKGKYWFYVKNWVPDIQFTNTI